jgi:nucleoid-associated protein EbfC
MFGKLGDMMGKFQEMKQRADEIKLKLDATSISITSAGDDIKIEITGNRKIKKLTIDSALQHGNKETLEEQLLMSFNKAIEAADKLNEDEMKKAATGLIPGM